MQEITGEHSKDITAVLQLARALVARPKRPANAPAPRSNCRSRADFTCTGRLLLGLHTPRKQAGSR